MSKAIATLGIDIQKVPAHWADSAARDGLLKSVQKTDSSQSLINVITGGVILLSHQCKLAVAIFEYWHCPRSIGC